MLLYQKKQGKIKNYFSNVSGAWAKTLTGNLIPLF